MLNHKPLAESTIDNDHPESFYRLLMAGKKLEAEGLLSRCTNIEAIAAEDKDILRVHTREHNDLINSIYDMDEKALRDEHWEKQSVYVCQDTAFCAKLAAGGTMELCRHVQRQIVDNGFAIVRPPGHHAEHDKAMGFCIYNNVAVATKYLQNTLGVKKVLIVDWDVHHGNGIQQVFDDDPSVMYISLHRYDHGDFYPGYFSASHDHVGMHEGRGYNVNIAWPCGEMGDPEYIHAFQRLIMPIAYEFAPDFVIVAAGFDAADGDEIGQCRVSPGGYAQMTHQLKSLARGKLVLSLEGGYNLASTSHSIAACVEVLLGDAPRLPQMNSVIRPEAVRAIDRTANALSPYWKCLKPRSTDPSEEATSEGGDDEYSYTLAQSLNTHRAKHMMKRFGLRRLLLQEDWDFRKNFSDQLFCSTDAFNNKNLVLLINDLGPLRIAYDDPQNINLNESRVVEAIYPYIKHALSIGSGLVTVNFCEYDDASIQKLRRALLEQVWQQITSGRNVEKIVILCAGGSGGVLTKVLSRNYVEALVKLVIMIPGSDEEVPSVNVAKSEWYFHHSHVVVPSGPPWDEAGTEENKQWGNFKLEGKRHQKAADQLLSMRKQLLPLITAAFSGSIEEPSVSNQHQSSMEIIDVDSEEDPPEEDETKIEGNFVLDQPLPKNVALDELTANGVVMIDDLSVDD